MVRYAKEVEGRLEDTAGGPIGEARTATEPQPYVGRPELKRCAALQMPEMECSEKPLDDPKSGLWSRPGG